MAARATSKTVSAADAYFQAKNLFFLHFDCEHTSTHLCQISAVCYSQETLEQVGVAFDEYVKPPVHRWNAEATTIHGLSTAHSRIVVAEPLSLSCGLGKVQGHGGNAESAERGTRTGLGCMATAWSRCGALCTVRSR